MTRPDGQSIADVLNLIDDAIESPASHKPGPTKAIPGSPEKIAILCRRLERSEQLFRPEDAQYRAGLDGSECA